MEFATRMASTAEKPILVLTGKPLVEKKGAAKVKDAILMKMRRKYSNDASEKVVCTIS
jgi:GTP:adenosylcobinamide-phosphate guanylyltransferase